MSKQYTTVKARKAFKAKVKSLGGKHCYVDFDRYGNPRVYVWKKVDGKTGPKIRIRTTVDHTSTFRREVADALDGKMTQVVAPPEPIQMRQPAAQPNTWRWVCQKFFEAPPSTDITSEEYLWKRRRILERTFDEPVKSNNPNGAKLGDMPYERFDDTVLDQLEKRMVKRVTKDIIVDQVTGRTEPRIKLEGHEAYNRLLIHVAAVMAWAKKEKIFGARINWAKEVEKVRSSNTKGHPTMTLEEIEQYRDFYPLGTTARAALELLLYGGPRAGDAFALGPHHVKQIGGREMIVYEQQKLRAKNPITAFIPLVPKLKEALDALNLPPNSPAFLISEFGKPYGSAKSFGNRFSKWCRKAGITDRSAHPMRKACVVRMILDDHTPFEIMAVTGHRTTKEVERYGREYLRERAAEAVFDKWLTKHAVAGSAAEAKMEALAKLLDAVKDKMDDTIVKQVAELLAAA